MKLSEAWLREYINPNLSGSELCRTLTMAGLEVESYERVADEFTQVVIGEVLTAEKHPEADRLKVCSVNVGEKEPLQIVCGASNVRAGLKVAVALIGARIPNNIKISKSKIRNVISHGMICSSKELNISEEGAGILELPINAPIGQSVWEYLRLDDAILDISITPNRGDCLSVLGLSKEIAALTSSPLEYDKTRSISPTIDETLPIEIKLPHECMRYVGRIIKNVKADAITPIEIEERLRRSNVRCISPIVDVMNYVMLELGQPMHAFDLNKIDKKILVRAARESELLTLLDGQEVQLKAGTMIIADSHAPLAIAGVMGGLDSGVTLQTQDIFLESAYFSSTSISKAVRAFRLTSESSYRFERGIDPTLQIEAIERATQLLLDIVGGQPGPTQEVSFAENLPQDKKLLLRIPRVHKILGFEIPKENIVSLLKNLGFTVANRSAELEVTVPARRHDINQEEDLIEEIIRLYGYEKLPSVPAVVPLLVANNPFSLQSELQHTLRDFGYQEVITYSFIDEKHQQLLDPGHLPKKLINPITDDMNVMRTNLWPGLLQTLLYNQHRQQERVRIFEIGLRFVPYQDNFLQERVLGGLISGAKYPLQWSESSNTVDFFDLKGDLINLFKLTKQPDRFTMQKGIHSALHPGQTADIFFDDQKIGVLGALHPKLSQQFKLSSSTYLFEIQLEQLEKICLPKYHEISKFPQIRRDIALFVDQTVPAQQIQDTIYEVGGDLLRDVTVFDVYHQGQGLGSSRKSIALALTLQNASRTLVDEEVTEIIERIVVTLKQRFAAELRG